MRRKRPRKTTMSDKGVKGLKPHRTRYAVDDPELRGHWIRVQPSGSKSFWTVARDPNGKQRWNYVGLCDALGIETARAKAREMLTRVRAGLPAIAPKTATFGTVMDDWLRRHVEKNKLRSRDKLVGLINRHIGPEFRAREFIAIRRDDITTLLDEIEDEHSSRQADSVLTIISSIATWYATRHSDYNSPLVKGMRRTNSKEKERDRKLDDGEIRNVWTAAGECGTFGKLVKMLLLVMQRLDRTITMKWDEIDADGVWTLPPLELGEKENIAKVQLPEAARAILASLPRFAGNPYVFAGQGDRHIAKSGKYMTRLRRKLPKDMEHFSLHDLRRTARSLMSRAGVSSEHAERAMGHVIPGIEGVYNRHEFTAEKSAALAKLANLIDAIVNPRENVVPMRKESR